MEANTLRSVWLSDRGTIRGGKDRVVLSFQSTLRRHFERS